MVPDQSKACVGLEYFCFKGDELWEMADDDLVELAKRELEQLGLGARRRRSSAASSRASRKAYPMYDADYGERVDVIQRLARGHRQPPAGRPQRPAPLQQLRPLDAHRDPRGGEHHRRAPTTTSGRSTPSPCTTRSTRSREQPYKRVPDTRASASRSSRES